MCVFEYCVVGYCMFVDLLLSVSVMCVKIDCGFVCVYIGGCYDGDMFCVLWDLV